MCRNCGIILIYVRRYGCRMAFIKGLARVSVSRMVRCRYSRPLASDFSSKGKAMAIMDGMARISVAIISFAISRFTAACIKISVNKGITRYVSVLAPPKACSGMTHVRPIIRGLFFSCNMSICRFIIFSLVSNVYAISRIAGRFSIISASMRTTVTAGKGAFLAISPAFSAVAKAIITNATYVIPTLMREAISRLRFSRLVVLDEARL